MGVTFSSSNKSVDMGYGGFMMLRQTIAKLISPTFSEHYMKLSDAPMQTAARADFFEVFNAKTRKMIIENVIAIEVVDFLLQSDCEGSITYEQVAMIYEKIKDHHDDTIYGYAAREDCATFSRIVAVFKDALDHRTGVGWY